MEVLKASFFSPLCRSEEIAEMLYPDEKPGTSPSLIPEILGIPARYSVPASRLGKNHHTAYYRREIFPFSHPSPAKNEPARLVRHGHMRGVMEMEGEGRKTVGIRDVSHKTTAVTCSCLPCAYLVSLVAGQMMRLRKLCLKVK